MEGWIAFIAIVLCMVFMIVIAIIVTPSGNKKKPKTVTVPESEFVRLNQRLKTLSEPRVYNVRLHTSKGMIYCGYEIIISGQTIDFFDRNPPSDKQYYGYTTYANEQSRQQRDNYYRQRQRENVYNEIYKRWWSDWPL